MEEASERALRFVLDGWREVVAGIIVAIASLAIVSLDPNDPKDWPWIAAAAAAIPASIVIVWAVRSAARRRARRQVGRASGNRIAILIARLVGDDRFNGSRQTVLETIQARFGESVELMTWPESLAISEGHNEKSEETAGRTVREWLATTGCDVLVWGRVRGQQVLSLRIGGRLQRPYALDEKTLSLPDDFGADLVTSITQVALDDAEVAADQGNVSIEQLRRVARRIEMISRQVQSHQIALAYSGVLSRIGQFVGDQEMRFQAVDIAVAAVKNDAQNLDKDHLFRANFNICSMLMSLAEWSLGRSSLDEALKYFESAREIHPEISHDLNYAILLSQFGDHELDKVKIEQAISIFDKLTKLELSPQNEETIGKAWHNRGISYLCLFSQTSDTSYIDKSIESFQEALNFRRQDNAPLYWAKTMNSLGGAYEKKSEVSGDSDNARIALRHLTAARSLYMERDMQGSVSDITYNIGCALSAAGVLDQDRDALVAAITELEAAEQAWAGQPDKRWMNVQNALGSANINLAIITGEPAFAVAGAAHFEQALSTLDVSEELEAWVGVSNNAARGHVVAGVLSHAGGSVREATNILERCAAALEQHPHHALGRMVRRNLADAYAKLSIFEADNTYLDKAISLHSAHFDYLDNERPNRFWVEEGIALCNLLFIKAQLENSIVGLRNAEEILRTTLKTFESQAQASESQNVLHEGEALLVQIETIRSQVEARPRIS